MKTADRYNRESKRELKEALQRQYLRLQTGMDSDDPCRPYYREPCDDSDDDGPFDTSDGPVTSSGPVTGEFMDRLKSNRRATMQFQ